MRLSAEYDSEEGLVLTKAAHSFLGGLAKLKASCHAALDGRIQSPVLSARLGKAVELEYDVEGGRSLCSASLGGLGSLSLQHDSQASQSSMVGEFRPHGVFQVVGSLFRGGKASRKKGGREGKGGLDTREDDEEGGGSLLHSSTAQVVLTSTRARALGSAQLTKLALLLPPLGHLQYVPRRPLKWPNGDLNGDALEGEDLESPEECGLSGSLRAPVGAGGKEGDTFFAMDFSAEPPLLGMGLRHKNKQCTVSPHVSLWPVPTLELGFKRRFSKAQKLSILYNATDATFAATYKYTPKYLGRKAREGEEEGEDAGAQPLKLKVGYDSRIRLFWSSLWLGKEEEGARRAPMKTKVQLMLQVPQDPIHPHLLLENAALMLRVKKRIDIL